MLTMDHIKWSELQNFSGLTGNGNFQLGEGEVHKMNKRISRQNRYHIYKTVLAKTNNHLIAKSLTPIVGHLVPVTQYQGDSSIGAKPKKFTQKTPTKIG